jgi:hypothetical protein
LNNLVLLCREHHRAVHEGGVRVCLDSDGQVMFFTPKGKVLAGAAPRGWDEVIREQPAPAHPPRPQPPRKYHRDIPREVEARVWEALDPS